MPFDQSKIFIIENHKTGVQTFYPKLKSCLMTDWSKAGCGFLLTQKHCWCVRKSPSYYSTVWRLVLAGSKFSNKAESMYAPTEGECIAEVRAHTKAKYFVLGCSDLTVVTDHKPIIKILGNRSLENIDNPRLLYKPKRNTAAFQVIHIAGKKNNGADAFSRFPG